MSLEQAIQNLKAARPDPAKVEALTAEAIKRRETPYEIRDLYENCGTSNDQYHQQRYERKELPCQLCGAVANVVTADDYYVRLPDPHLDWHNNIERRLQQLEER